MAERFSQQTNRCRPTMSQAPSIGNDKDLKDVKDVKITADTGVEDFEFIPVRPPEARVISDPLMAGERELVLDVDGTLAFMKEDEAKTARATTSPWNDTNDLSPSGKENMELIRWWYEVRPKTFIVNIRPGLWDFGAALKAAKITRVVLASVNSTTFVERLGTFLSGLWDISVYWRIFPVNTKKEIAQLFVNAAANTRDRIVVLDDQPGIWSTPSAQTATILGVLPWSGEDVTRLAVGTSDEYVFCMSIKNREKWSVSSMILKAPYPDWMVSFIKSAHQDFVSRLRTQDGDDDLQYHLAKCVQGCNNRRNITLHVYTRRTSAAPAPPGGIANQIIHVTGNQQQCSVCLESTGLGSRTPSPPGSKIPSPNISPRAAATLGDAQSAAAAAITTTSASAVAATAVAVVLHANDNIPQPQTDSKIALKIALKA